MNVIQGPAEFHTTLMAARQAVPQQPGDDGRQRVGLVPTMGALHEGHLSLCRASVSAHPVSAATIFVNPLQFGPHEDLSRYPRDLDSDLELLESVGIDYVFVPDAGTFYPPDFQTYVEVDVLSKPMEGAARPGHFRGVATVVLKLFNLAGPCHAYFGDKDFQQLRIIRQLVRDLEVPVVIHGLPTIRESDGLALSSRNRYLTSDERRAAPALYQALVEAQRRARAGETDAAALLDDVRGRIGAAPLLHLEYVALVDAESLQPMDVVSDQAMLAAAVRVGSARLIDHVQLLAPGKRTKAE